MSSATKTNRVAIVGGARTPFAKAGTKLKQFDSLALGTHSVDGALSKLDLDPQLVDQLAFGSVVLDPSIPHLAREINYNSQLPVSVRSLSMTDNCITGTSAITTIANAITLGQADVGIAGGVESMSNPPVMFNKKAGQIFLEAGRAKTMSDRLKLFFGLRPKDFTPWDYGVQEPSTGLSMGEHTEITVKAWGIDRAAQDEIAYRSQINAAAATEDGRLKAEIHPLAGIDSDPLIRPNTTLEVLASLPPVFDRSDAGTLTAGNSSPLTDGAASVVLMSEDKAKELNHEPLGFIKGFINVGIDPDDGLLMGPGVSVPRLLREHGLTLDDLDIIEMHEAFGGQVASNLKAWEDGWKEPAIGTVDRDRLNPLGSSIAVGHPFAATGTRIVLTIANELKRRNGKYGLVSICGAGAIAVAMLIERA